MGCIRIVLKDGARASLKNDAEFRELIREYMGADAAFIYKRKLEYLKVCRDRLYEDIAWAYQNIGSATTLELCKKRLEEHTKDILQNIEEWEIEE